VKRRYYKVWIIFIPTNGEHLWEWQNWMQFYEIIDPLLTKTRGNKSIHIFQSRQSGITINARPMAWTKKNMEKWTHHSPLTEDFSDDLSFSFLELWCPSEQKCENEAQPPDVFVGLDQDTDITGAAHGIANQRLTIAVAKELHASESAVVEATIADVFKLAKPLACFELNSRWVFKKRDIFNKEIRWLRDFFKKGWDFNTIPSIEMFDFQDAHYEIVASYKLVNGALEKTFNCAPNVNQNN
jgi:hypothetical protein